MSNFSLFPPFTRKALVGALGSGLRPVVGGTYRGAIQVEINEAGPNGAHGVVMVGRATGAMLRAVITHGNDGPVSRATGARETAALLRECGERAVQNILRG